MTPARRVLALAALVVVLAGCRVDVQLAVRVRDGVGTVESTIALDAEAVGRLETNDRTLADTVRLGDLAAAGWNVGEWTRHDDGGARLALTHEFADEDELRVRLGELDAGSVVREVEIVSERGLFRSRDEVALDVDLQEIGTRLLDDAELVASLQDAGLDVATLDRQLEAELRDSLQVRVSVEAPGGRVTTVDLAPGQRTSVAAARSDFDANRLVLVAIAGLLLFLAVLLYLSAAVSARRSRPRRGDPGDDAERVPLM